MVNDVLVKNIPFPGVTECSERAENIRTIAVQINRLALLLVKVTCCITWFYHNSLIYTNRLRKCQWTLSWGLLFHQCAMSPMNLVFYYMDVSFNWWGQDVHYMVLSCDLENHDNETFHFDVVLFNRSWNPIKLFLYFQKL